MNFNKLMNFASQKQKTVENESTKKYSTQTTAAKREQRARPKGVQSAAVRAFLERQAQEEKQKEAKDRLKKAELMNNLRKARGELNTQKRANAMASRTKDVPKIFKFDGSSGVERVASRSEEQERIRREMQEKLQSFKEKNANKSGGRIKSKSVILDDGYQSDDEKKRKPEKPGQFKSKHTISDDDSSSDDDAPELKPYVRPHLDKPRPSSTFSTNSTHKDKHSKSHKRDKHKHDKHDKQSRHKDVKPHHSKTEMKETAKKPVADPIVPKPKPKPKPKKRPQGPPPMSFEQMLALAKQNENKTALKEEKQEKDKEDSGHPMTQDEKERAARRKTKEYQNWIKFGTPIKQGSSSSSSSANHGSPRSKGETSVRSKQPLIPEHREKVRESPVPSRPSSHGERSRDNPAGGGGGGTGKKLILKPKRPSEIQERAQKYQEKMRSEMPIVPKSGNRPDKKPEKPEKRLPSVSAAPKMNSSAASSKTSVQTKKAGSVHPRPRERPSSFDQINEMQKSAPQPQMSTWDRIYGQMNKNKPDKKKRVIESDDEEYDDDYMDQYEDDFIDDDGDMADFIDDEPTGDVSKYIREIFNYDKRKFKNEREDDLRGMEASYTRQMHEEAISAKIGYQEDLEDMKKEEEENRQRLMRQKAKKMKRR